MSDYVYDMKFTAEKLATLIEAAIGRRPDSIGASDNRSMSFTFKDTDITPQERQTALAALPSFMKLVYSFSRAVVDSEVE